MREWPSAQGQSRGETAEVARQSVTSYRKASPIRHGSELEDTQHASATKFRQPQRVAVPAHLVEEPGGEPANF